jgi:DeoR/GlpR family transcriptional regulator of sugar metabolism
MLRADISEKYKGDFEIISSGGILNVYKNFFTGPQALNLFEEIKVDIAFVSVTAIDLKAGVTADNVYEAEISRIILQRYSKKKIDLIYSAKFGKVSFVKVAPVEVFDEIISDVHLLPDIAAQYAESGIKMTLV